jgi:hypothetical protein
VIWRQFLPASGAPYGIGAASERSPSTGRSFHGDFVIHFRHPTKTIPQPPRASMGERCAEIAARIPKRLGYSFTDAQLD